MSDEKKPREPGTHLEQYCYDLHQEVLARSSDDNNPEMREDAFSEIVLELLSEHNESDGSTVCYWNAKSRGATPAAKLNAWSLSGDGATLDVFIVLYHGTGKPVNVSKSDVEAQYKLLRGFLRRSLDGFHVRLEDSNGVFHAMNQIHEAKAALTTVRLFFLTDGEVKSAAVEQEQIEGLELKYVFWDIKKLSRLKVGSRQTIQLDFANNFGGALPALEVADATGEYRTFLAFMPAPILARIYGQHGQRLLERNVRAFLQAKGKINRGLQKTIREEPHRFLAYNNGLCCTAAEVEIDPGKDGHVRLKRVDDFQIVNGGQTTASIYHAVKKEKLDVSHVMVQVKLTILTDPARMSEIVPLISIYANSQNKINAADFSANGPYHQQLERLSRTMWAPPRSGLERGIQWYYERARGSYNDDKYGQGTPAKIKIWSAERPIDAKFTKTDLAKFEHAWLGLPHLVAKGNEKNFIDFASRQEEDGAAEVNELYFKRLVAKAILWRNAEKIFDTLELVQSRAQSVAYAIAWLAEESDRRLDLDSIWAEQRISPMLAAALKSALAQAHAHLSKQVGIVTEAAKRAEVWEEFRDSDLELGEGWQKEWAANSLVDHSSVRDAMAAEWERLRHIFVNDSRTIEGLEEFTGLQWMKGKRRDMVSTYANLPFNRLLGRPGLGLKKAKVLVEMLSIAAKDQLATQ